MRSLLISVTLLASSLCLADPYIETKSEYKGTDSDYKKQVHRASIGVEGSVGPFTSYLEAGGGSSLPNSVSKHEDFKFGEAGLKLKKKRFSCYGKVESVDISDGGTNWKFEAGTKFKF